jgi:formyl-CoA transferase
MMENMVTEYDITGYVRERSGSILPGIAPSNVYPAAGGAMILIGGNGDNVFRRLATIMGRPELAEDPRFVSHAARGANQALLDEIISDWTRGQGLESLLELLEREGVPCGRVYTAPDMLTDPQFAARDTIVSVDHPIFGPVRMQNAFPKLSHTPGEVRWPGPPLGAHTQDVLRQWAGLSQNAIADLSSRGVI